MVSKKKSQLEREGEYNNRLVKEKKEGSLDKKYDIIILPSRDV